MFVFYKNSVYTYSILLYYQLLQRYIYYILYTTYNVPIRSQNVRQDIRDQKDIRTAAATISHPVGFLCGKIIASEQYTSIIQSWKF